MLSASSTFMLHEQSQAVFEGELGVLGIGLLFAQGFAEGRQAQLQQLIIEDLQTHGNSFRVNGIDYW
jgi:hypothetical protein